MARQVILTIPDEFVASIEAWLDSSANTRLVAQENGELIKERHPYLTIDDAFNGAAQKQIQEIAKVFPPTAVAAKIAQLRQLQQEIEAATKPGTLLTPPE